MSLNDLKAAPSAITPDCLIDTFVEVAEKSVEPEPPHMPHILEKKQDEGCLSLISNSLTACSRGTGG